MMALRAASCGFTQKKYHSIAAAIARVERASISRCSDFMGTS
jgi:hypothetical protein